MLVDESRTADVVVVGARGSGGFADLVIGSTTLHLASQAHCPVLAVPVPVEQRPHRHGVVVGVDGSAVSTEAVGAAFEWAADAARAVARGPRLDRPGAHRWRRA